MLESTFASVSFVSLRSVSLGFYVFVFSCSNVVLVGIDTCVFVVVGMRNLAHLLREWCSL